jgi:hypothetical protein
MVDGVEDQFARSRRHIYRWCAATASGTGESPQWNALVYPGESHDTDYSPASRSPREGNNDIGSSGGWSHQLIYPYLLINRICA